MKFSIQSVYNWYRSTIRNPKYRWWVVLGTLVYFISPIDLIPDILFPVVGELDDVFLLTLLVTEVSQMLIEGFKARQATVSTENPAPPANTIDVDAVPVK
ncbi:YkvA family protein [Calothrix sp. PCC 6303]|uniref:YkvA family protein n=1 Tax=Calothrix sp. PCC 6303 TaxID=1170562 RepID=UPI0002A031AE|nr:YkvA family protein [Calothrix sp. PCC 6303]AFZ04468.1 protein of unknown function DUF1232 [Calothrix sp. PCC 6303]